MPLNEIISELKNMPPNEFSVVADFVRDRENLLIEEECAKRAEELKNGDVQGLTHEDVFDSLKQKYQCG